jgi:hypothetical protein
VLELLTLRVFLLESLGLKVLPESLFYTLVWVCIAVNTVLADALDLALEPSTLFMGFFGRAKCHL